MRYVLQKYVNVILNRFFSPAVIIARRQKNRMHSKFSHYLVLDIYNKIQISTIMLKT